MNEGTNREIIENIADMVTRDKPESVSSCFGPNCKSIFTNRLHRTAWMSDDSLGWIQAISRAGWENTTQGTFSRDGNLVLFGAGNVAQFWNRDLAIPAGARFVHDSEVVSVALSPDGETVAVGCADCTVHLWDVQTGKPRGEAATHPPPGTKVYMWNVPSDKPRFSGVQLLRFSPDGRYLLAVVGLVYPDMFMPFIDLVDAATGKLVSKP